MKKIFIKNALFFLIIPQISAIQFCIPMENMENNDLNFIKNFDSKYDYYFIHDRDNYISCDLQDCIFLNIKNDAKRINRHQLLSKYCHNIQSCFFDWQKDFLTDFYGKRTKNSIIRKNKLLSNQWTICQGETICAIHPTAPIVCLIEKQRGILELFDDNVDPLNKPLVLDCIPETCSISSNGIAAILHKGQNKISLVNIIKETLTKTVITCPDNRKFKEQLFFFNSTLAAESTISAQDDYKSCLHFWNIITGKCIFSLNLLKNSSFGDINFKEKEILLKYNNDNDQKYALFSIAPALKNKIIETSFFLKNIPVILPKDIIRVIISLYDCYLLY